jgi:hypothetical protein
MSGSPVLVIDVELTCSDDGTILPADMELIKLAAVWPTPEGQILDRFHALVASQGDCCRKARQAEEEDSTEAVVVQDNDELGGRAQGIPGESLAWLFRRVAGPRRRLAKARGCPLYLVAAAASGRGILAA